MDFYKRVALVCKEVPYGKVATYGQIALLCGKPKNARQVGFALNRNLAGEDVPAHRIVNRQGYLTGGGAFEEPDTQESLLEAEGVKVEFNQSVNMGVFGWKNTLDLAISLSDRFEELGI